MTSITRERIASIDLLKGLVMVIMAIDHVRDYFHNGAFLFDPTDPDHSTLPIFFTRWITHFCAPTFSFLAGMSAFQAGKRRTIPELSVFLFTRGLWLVFLELTVINFGWYFDIEFRSPTLAVIWALGLSMVVLAILVHLPRRIILVISLVLIFGHHLLDGVHDKGNMAWAMLHDGGFFQYAHGYHMVVIYPIIPWVAVMPLGYCMGALYDDGFDRARRRKILIITGVSAISLFLILNGVNGYGDPGEWRPYDTTAKTMMSFLNPRKYPPSLLFLCMTLGPSMIFLAVTERLRGPVVTFFSTFGRVPFFYYILHIYLIHLIAMVFAQAAGFGWKAMVLPDWLSEVPALRGYGFDLWVTYVVWIVVILVLYPVCRAFDAYKGRHRDRKWLSYL